ncbi:MAG TPA: acyltransferase [Nitrospirota bacterium]|nr:acyltransferase [Nitrospirota bacterium]HUK99310.1 acyltransferase [Nitrospirota bacterium]
MFDKYRLVGLLANFHIRYNVLLMGKKRLEDIDRGKGIAIFLVVTGHIVAVGIPAEAAWYQTLREYIYSFHMSFFMFLSGVVFFLTCPDISSVKDYLSFIRKKFMRLMPAFFLFSIIVAIGKVLAMHFFYVDNPPKSFCEILKVFYVPTDSSAASFLWYIYALFLLNALVPLLMLVTARKLWIIFLLAFIIHFVPVPHIFAMHEVFYHLLYFVLGGVIVSSWTRYIFAIDEFRWLWLGVFAVGLFILHPDRDATWLGLIAIPAIHAFVRLPVTSSFRILNTLGLFSFPIYLMNTISMGLVKAILLKFTTLDGENFIWIALLLLSAGLIVPIFVKREVFPHMPILDKITT